MDQTSCRWYKFLAKYWSTLVLHLALAWLLFKVRADLRQSPLKVEDDWQHCCSWSDGGTSYSLATLSSCCLALCSFDTCYQLFIIMIHGKICSEFDWCQKHQLEPCSTNLLQQSQTLCNPVTFQWQPLLSAIQKLFKGNL